MDRDQVYLIDILEAARLAVRYLEEVSEEVFLRDIQCQDSVIRRIEIIGEAAGRISLKTKNSFSVIPWGEMIGMKNILIHEYDAVDLNLVYHTVKNDLSRLISLLDDILSSE